MGYKEQIACRWFVCPAFLALLGISYVLQRPLLLSPTLKNSLKEKEENEGEEGREKPKTPRNADANSFDR